jgi:hypothetical protein
MKARDQSLLSTFLLFYFQWRSETYGSKKFYDIIEIFKQNAVELYCMHKTKAGKRRMTLKRVSQELDESSNLKYELYVLKDYFKKEPELAGISHTRVYINKLSKRNTIPPRKIANTTSKAVIPKAFLQPNSLPMLKIKARQGMYIIVTSAKTIS